MNVHSRFAEDLALYALGTLEGDEQVELEKHLKDCADCRHELEQLRGDAALLALSASGPAPPQQARRRLINAVTREPRISLEQPSARRTHSFTRRLEAEPARVRARAVRSTVCQSVIR